MTHTNAARMTRICGQIDSNLMELARLARGFERDRGYEHDGCPNSVAWLKVHGRLSTALAMEVMAVARRLPELPEVERAAESGAIGFEHAAAIADAADKLGSGSLLAHVGELVQKAEQVDPSSFRQEVKKIEQQVDAELMRREAEHAYRSRYLDLTGRPTAG